MRGAILRCVGRSAGTASQLVEGPPTTEGQLIHLGNQTAETPCKPPSPAVIASLTLLFLSVSIITTLPSYPNLSPGFLLGSADCTPSPQQFIFHAATRGIVALRIKSGPWSHLPGVVAPFNLSHPASFSLCTQPPPPLSTSVMP